MPRSIDSNHSEVASNIIWAPRDIYIIKDSHVTINTSFDYLPDTTTNGALYIDDSGGEGKHSTVYLNNYFGRQWLTTSDPVGGYSIYINNMNDRTKIHVSASYTQVSVTGSFATAYGQMGLTIGGNATNEPTLASAVATGRDIIGSGNFLIFKYKTSSTTTGQNQAMNIGIGALGNLNGLYRSKTHVTPTFYDAESYGTGTLTSSTLYSYAAAVCNTLPDGTIQYGAVTSEWTQTAPAGGAQGFELYMPSAANGATLVVWRKTGSGVLSSPDRYVVIPVGSAATRLIDTGANISKLPWITTSVPVPNTVAAANHTSDNIYLGSSPFSAGAVAVPGGLSATGTPSSSTFLAGDGVWRTPVAGSSTDDPTVMMVSDDFTSGTTTSGMVGNLGWNFNNGTRTWLDGITNHPGILQFGTGTTASTICALFLATNATIRSFAATDLWDVTYWVRPSSSDTDTQLRIGVLANAIGTTATGAWFEKLYADTDWFTVTRNNAGSVTRTDSTFAVPGTTTWTKLRVRRIDASTVGFTVDSHAEATVTTTLPDTPALIPTIQITNQTAVNKTIDIDRAVVIVTGLTR